jgi:hypothetical protein
MPGPGGLLVYRCRRCGRLDRSIHVPDLIKALVCLSSEFSLPDDWGPMKPNLTGLHHCPGGWLGVTDLIGGRPDGAADDPAGNPGAVPARHAPADVLRGPIGEGEETPAP